MKLLNYNSFKYFLNKNKFIIGKDIYGNIYYDNGTPIRLTFTISPINYNK